MPISLSIKPSINPSINPSIKPMQNCVLILLCCLLGSCATGQQAASSSPESEAEQSAADSSQKTLTVNSSHGVQEIRPTVVAYTAEPSNSEADAPINAQHADFGDPLEFINRPVFAFNDVLYRYLLIPVSHGYKKIMPDPFENGVSNLFANIREPINGINNLLQGKALALGHNLSRFVINSTLGILGLFDPAQDWFGIDSKVSHINDTLRSYDVGYGSFIVLPFLGQSDLRNGFSFLAESFASPIRQLTDNPETLYIQSYAGFHRTVPQLLAYEELHKDKEDPYVFFRNLYMQGVLRDRHYPAAEVEQSEAKSESAAVPQDNEAQP